jgi:serine/threonine protein kinase
MMQRQEKLRQLFADALKLPASERAGFLREICGPDKGLFEEVEALLAGPDSTGTSIDGLRLNLKHPAGVSSVTRNDPVSEGELILHYEIQGRLGAGGMGVVFRALDRKLQRSVALKFLPFASFRDENSRERLLREAMAASALDHPNVGAVHSIEETADGRLFIVMPCYPGETVKQRIDRGPLPASQAVDMAMQAASGLAKAHQKGIIHRDIKPSNLIVTPDGMVKIVDFGLAKFLDRTSLTETGTTMGTAAYMSPEQISGGPIDYRTDIWSLAATFYEMLQGKPPFDGENAAAMLYSVVNNPPAPLTGVPQPLQQVVLKCLAKNPQERYGSMADLIHALERSGPPSPALLSTKRGTLPRLHRTVQRRLIWSAAIVGFLFAAGAGSLWIKGHRHPAAIPAPVITPSQNGQQPQMATSVPAAPPVSPPPKDVAPENTKTQASAKARAKKPADREPGSSGRAPYSGPKEGRLVWTGELEPGQSADLTGKSDAGSVSGSLPGVPISIEVHPATVHVVTAPSSANQWRRVVVQNDGKKVSVVIVSWKTAGQ